MPKLSPRQQEALEKLAHESEWCSAYRLQISLNTLEALKRKGLVICDYLAWYPLDPRGGILWKLKKEAAR